MDDPRKIRQPMASNLMRSEKRDRLMVEKKRVQDEVAETLASLDRLERLEAGSDFLARLRARLSASPAPVRRRRFVPLLAPVLRPALLALLVLANLLTLFFVARGGRPRGEARAASMTALAADYSLIQEPDEIGFSGEEAGR